MLRYTSAIATQLVESQIVSCLVTAESTDQPLPSASNATTRSGPYTPEKKPMYICASSSTLRLKNTPLSLTTLQLLPP